MNPIIFAIGALIYGSLYLFSIFIGGYIFGHPLASQLAIADMGLTYISFSYTLSVFHGGATSNSQYLFSQMLVGVTVILGAVAGFFLL